MDDVGLVLEGGGSRGVYTAGVLRYLMEQDIYIPYVIGVSAGACNGSSYVSHQMDRNRRVNIDFMDHPEYLSYRNLIRKKQLFGMDFLFDRLPNELAPFDFETFHNAKEELVVGVTDCVTGEPVFYRKEDYDQDILTVIRASSSLPLVAPEVHYDNRILLDGGISAPIPIKQSELDGKKRNVIILTRNRGYYKQAQKFGWYFRKKYKEYPGLVQAIEKRHHLYNETLEYIYEEEKRGNVFIVSPSEPLDVGRIERDKRKLTTLYEQGIEDVKKLEEPLKEFLT